MSDQKTVKIGGASGMWGDSMLSTRQLLTCPELKYLMYESLAEITMGILTRAHDRDPKQGYCIDVIHSMIANELEAICERGVKVITNAGGVNPEAAAESLRAIADAKGLALKIAVIIGDNVLPIRDQIVDLGIIEMETGASLPADNVISMNAYLGAFPIADALAAGADVVITGRCVDSALVLGPLIHEFGWTANDFDRLAQGSLVGHLLECGPQSVGGLLTDWDSYDSWENMGFPVAECFADGSFVLTKPDNTDGIVNKASAAEQTLYEIGNPTQYMLPDVVCDFTGVSITEIATDRVLVKGARGRPPTPYYKACAQHQNGFRINPIVMMSGRNAKQKAIRLGQNAIARGQKIFKEYGFDDFSHTNIEILGSEHYYGENSRQNDSREVLLYLAVHHQKKEALALFAREFTSFGLASAQGFCSGITGRARPAPYIQLLSFLIPKSLISATIRLDGEDVAAREVAGDLCHELDRVSPPDSSSDDDVEKDVDLKGVPVPLLSIAYARSGDKGNYSNIGLVARHEDFLPLIAAQISASRVKAHFTHLGVQRVERFPLPGIGAFNYLLHQALGGGGTASLRFDTQGKGFGQNLLEMTLVVPEKLLQHSAFKTLS